MRSHTVRILTLLLFSAPLVFGGDPPPKLGFYLVRKGPAANLRLFDTPAFPKLGYIASEPELAVEQLEGVSVGTYRDRSAILDTKGNVIEQAHEDRPSLVVELTARDSKALESLTAAHRGERILFMLGSEPLLAPVILDTLRTRSLQITPRAGADVETLKNRLETLVRKPK